jgi:hypothetical protein
MTAGVKRCAMCKQTLPTSEFNVRRRSKDGLQLHCRECNRRASKAYYRRNPDRHKKDVDLNRKRYAARDRAILLDYLRDHPCVDCGEDDLVVLEFDHVRGVKDRGLFTMARDGANEEALRAEILKCEVRCVNCHVRKTARTSGSWRSRISP